MESWYYSRSHWPILNLTESKWLTLTSLRKKKTKGEGGIKRGYLHEIYVILESK
jgi:hypothetical protein